MEYSGKGKYFAKEDNIRKIFVDLNDLKNREGVDIKFGPFLEEFEKIAKEVSNRDTSNDNTFPFSLYCSRLDWLEKEINDKFGQFYIAHLYVQKVKTLLEDLNEDKYSDIIDECEKLIKSLIEIESKDDKDNVYDEGIKTLYDALLNESALEKNSILSRIKAINNDRIRESLGTIIKNDLSTFDEKELLNIKIRYISKGLGYDYLDSEIIKEIASKKISEKYEEYQERKKTALSYLLEKADVLASDEKNVASDRKKSRKRIRKLRLHKNIALVKIASLSAIPIILLSGLGKLGSTVGGKYKNTIRVFDAKTHNQIGDTETVYVYNDSPYEVIITKYTPWREKLTNDGYIRDKLEFKYTSKTMMDINEISPNELFKLISYYDQTTEEKQELGENDSMIDQEIFIRETIADKNDKVPHPGIIVCFILLGIMAFLTVDAAIDHFSDTDFFNAFKEAFNAFKENRQDLKYEKANITKRVIKKRYEQIGERIVEFQSEYEEKLQKYGDLISGNEPEQIEEIKRYFK